MEVAIALNKLSKRYGRHAPLALNDVSLQVGRGEVYGFLGANGAGKSTTIRCLLNFIQPSSGHATVLGMDVVRDSVRLKHSVGYLSGDVALYRKLTGRQLLDFMATLQPPKRKDYVRTLAKRFEAELNKPIGTLSKGNRQKLGLLQAFMHEPDVLILDEPTSGLDPLMQEAFYELVIESKKRGAAVFASSHNLGEVRRMCDRVGFIRAGKLVSERSLSELAATALHTFIITFGKEPLPIAELRKIPHASVPIVRGQNVTVKIKGELSPLFNVLARHSVTAFEHQAINLEEEFLQLYGKDAA